MTASAPQNNVEERDEERSCPAVSYGRVSEEKRVLVGAETDPNLESPNHLTWSGECHGDKIDFKG
jgi:hypothetical protein